MTCSCLLQSIKVAEVESRQASRNGDTFQFISSKLVKAMASGDWVRAAVICACCVRYRVRQR
jgi:ribosomal protein L32